MRAIDADQAAQMIESMAYSHYRTGIVDQLALNNWRHMAQQLRKMATELFASNQRQADVLTWLESQEFYELLYRYRTSSATDQGGTAQKFNAVKAEIVSRCFGSVSERDDARALSAETGCGMAECIDALRKAGGDYLRAVSDLKTRGF